MSTRKLNADAELEKLQQVSFSYFLHETNSDNGLVIDKTAADWPASIAATAFALAAYPVAVERGFMSRAAAVERTLTTLPNPYGFKATCNSTYPLKSSNLYGWVSPWHYGLNQGPIILMIENYRTGLLWRLTRACPYIVRGLQRAGFEGGWL